MTQETSLVRRAARVHLPPLDRSGACQLPHGLCRKPLRRVPGDVAQVRTVSSGGQLRPALQIANSQDVDRQGAASAREPEASGAPVNSLKMNVMQLDQHSKRPSSTGGGFPGRLSSGTFRRRSWASFQVLFWAGILPPNPEHLFKPARRGQRA